jgi:hypothetical protein
VIYFVLNRRARAFKIGLAEDPTRRLAELQTGSPDRLELLAWIPGDGATERQWHREWAGHRLEGEWFTATVPLARAIRRAVWDRGYAPGPIRAGFRDLVCAEPRLKTLYHRAASLRIVAPFRPRFCANAAWYGYGRYRHKGIKPVLLPLVGWDRKGHELLGNHHAYDIAYQTIYEAIPDCRKRCACQVVLNALV